MTIDMNPIERLEPESPSPRKDAQPITRLELAAIASIVALFLFQSFLVLRQGAPFGHDEAVYALRARDLVRDGDPLFYWWAYRAPGLPLSVTPLWLFRPTEPFLRAVVTGFGAITLLASWSLGRTLFDRRTGLIAAGGLALTPVFISSATQLWPDVPGAAITAVTLALYAWALTRPRLPVWIVVAIPILTGIATLFRFAAPLALAPGLVALTLWQRERALQQWKTVASIALLSGVVVGTVLIVPTATAWAQSASSTPIAPLEAVRDQKADAPWTDGFVDYWHLRARVFDGLPRLLLLVGAATGAVAATQHLISRRAFLTVVGTGVATFFLLASTVHGEPRYLAPTFAVFWLAAAAGIAYLVRGWSMPVTIAVGVLLVGIWIPASFSDTEAQSRWNIVGQATIKTASRAIDSSTPDYECSAVSSYTPQVDWYSQCRTMGYNLNSVVTSHPLLPEGDSFLVIVAHGKRQPTDSLLQEYVESTDGVFTTAGDPSDGPPRFVEVYRTESDG